MIAFWLIALLMALAAVAALTLPLLRRRARTAGDDEALIGVYREREAELVREHEQGNIDDAELTEAREELERELLAASDSPKRPLITRPGRPLATVATVAVVIPLAAVILYALTGRPGLVDDPGATGLSPAQIERFRNMEPEQRIRRLEPLIAERPGATRGLVLLAQAYRATGRYGDAVDAYARARAQGREEDPWLVASQAEALLLANGRRFTTSVERLVQRALELDQRNPLALMLAGHAAMARGERQQAVTYWQRLREAMPEDSDNRAMLDRLIAQARGDASGADDPGATGRDGAGSGDGDAGVTVRVRLSSSLADAAPAGTPVFVFARRAGANGSGPPLAVARTTVDALPARIRLTDANAMTSGARLSQAERVRVTARAALSGGVKAQAGDLEGATGPVVVGTGAETEITIDRRIGEAGDTATGATATGAEEDTGEPQIAVSLRLAPALADAAPDGTPVFVFARSASEDSGGPPLAVARTTLGDLPTRIRLTDANAMTSAARLSQAERVRVTARASLSGGVAPQSGDLEGSSGPVAVGPDAATEIAIDRRIP